MSLTMVSGDEGIRSTLSVPHSPLQRNDNKPPPCPACRRGFVMIAMHPGRDAAGNRVRRQLWGCPVGHASVYRTGGRFGDIDLFVETGG